MTSMYKETGLVKTSMYCHNCSKNFIAQIDFDINGNHIIECPHCMHEHCRVIKDGLATSDRWDTREQRIDVEKSRVWKHDSLQMTTTSACNFLREKWLNR